MAEQTNNSHGLEDLGFIPSGNISQPHGLDGLGFVASHGPSVPPESGSSTPEEEKGLTSRVLDSTSDAAQRLGKDVLERTITMGVPNLAFPAGAAISAPISDVLVRDYEKIRGLLTGQDIPESQPESMKKAYLDELKSRVQEEEKLKQDFPVASRVSEFAGTLAPAILTAGATGIAPLGAQATLRQILAKQGAGALAKEIGKRSAEAGLLTAAQSIAQSPYSVLEGQEGIKKQAATGLTGLAAGAALGPAFGYLAEEVPGAIKATGGAIGKGIEKISEDRPMFAQLAKAFGRGKEGIPIKGTTSGLLAQETEKQATVKGIQSQLEKPVEVLKAMKTNILDNAAQEGVRINPSADAGEILSVRMAALLPGMKKDVQRKLEIYAEHGMAPSALDDLRTALYEPMIKARRANDGQTADLLNQIRQQMGKSLEERVEGLSRMNAQISDLLAAGQESLLGKSVSKLGSKREEKLGNTIQELLESARSRKPSAPESLKSIEDLTSGLSALEQKHPGILETTGLDPQRLKQDILQGADITTAAQKMQGFSPAIESPGMALPFMHKLGIGLKLPGERALLKGAQAAGATSRIVSNIGQTLQKAPERGMNLIADRLMQSSNAQTRDLARQLLEATTPGKRTAALLTLMQNKQARAELGIGQEE